MIHQPLAETLRPKSIGEIIGQDHLVGAHGFITRLLKQKKPLSLVLWGPPGSGKTSLARLYAQAFQLRFITLSGVWDGVSELKKIVKEIIETPLLGKSAILFVDEIHRFNKAQQDAFLPFVENGTLILIGATAENPSFYLNAALLSRLRVLTLNTLDENALLKIVERYESKIKPLPLTGDAKSLLVKMAQGDGRYLLNLIENIEALGEVSLVEAHQLEAVLQKRAALYDKSADHHYNLISALHKAVRGSDPDGALYWLTRMLEGGEDPLYIARRLMRMATEDIGLADPQALTLAIAAKDTYEMLGSPEGELALAEVCVYLALAPKSTAIYTAYKAARQIAKETSHLSPPKIILNAPTTLMKNLGYGKGYAYDPDCEEGFSGQNYFPDDLARQEFYFPIEKGFEREMKKRKSFFTHLRNKKNSA